MHVCGEGKLHPRFRFTFWRNSKNEQGKPRSEPETAKNAFFHDDECRKLETHLTARKQYRVAPCGSGVGI